jgi:hypothetical protein
MSRDEVIREREKENREAGLKREQASREDVATTLFAVGGLLLGGVLGFMIANSTTKAQTEARVAQRETQASVNSSNGPELPQGHPNVGAGRGPAAGGQLPAGHPDIGSGSQPGGASAGQPGGTSGATEPPGSIELPSLEPLPASSKAERAEQKFKNIQVLKGVPSERWMPIMFAFKGSLGVECTFCHVKGEWEKDDKDNKQIARKMIKMVKDINSQLGGIGKVSCFTCHRGQQRPAN